MKTTYIYALIDPRDNQVRYIGKSNNPEYRYRNHYNSARDKNTHKRNWINSIRKDGLRPELLILDEVSIDNWQYWEVFYISLYKTFGFNLVNYTYGGDGSTFGNSGSFKKGNTPFNKGIPHSNETKKKISDKLTGTRNKASFKPIIQYDMNYNEVKRYKSAKDAIIDSNGLFCASKISSCCKGDRKHHREFIWKYDDGSNLSDVKFKLRKKPVIQYDIYLNKLNIFESVSEASVATNVSSSGIIGCCKGRGITAGSFIWRYECDDLLSIKKDFQKKSIIQYDMNLNELNRFDSITVASKITGVDIKGISSCCLGRIKKSGGFIWKFNK